MTESLREKRQHRGRKAYRKGLGAEFLCGLFLRLKGYHLVGQRYKNPMGEIDLIAVRGQALVFVEVKARCAQALAAEAVSEHQQARLARAASLFLARHPRYTSYHVRFDVMLVSPWRWPAHIKNAFMGHFL